jgi:hypothetical protein
MRRSDAPSLTPVVYIEVLDGPDAPHGEPLWSDATTPRTDRPVRFAARSLNHEKLSRTWRFKELGERGSAIIPPFPRA